MVDINFDSLTVIISLVIALVSLIIAMVALRISRATFFYASKDYTPHFNCEPKSKDRFLITNNSRGLFKVDYICGIKVRYVGIEDSKNDRVIRFPILEQSHHFRWIKKQGRTKKIQLNLRGAGPCAYQLCPMKNSMRRRVLDKLEKDYYSGSKKGYALPSLQGLEYIIEIVYTDAFQERKAIILRHAHVHGYGIDQTRMTDEQLDATLKHVNLPEFDSVQELWSYAESHYSTTASQYFGGPDPEKPAE